MDCDVIRHVEIEDLGYLGETLAEGSVRVRYLDAEALPDDAERSDAALIVLGGPMGVYEADRYPYLTREIELIREALRRDRPTLGICLGAQLLAAAAGGDVRPGSKGKEIGWAEVRLTDVGVADSIWEGFPLSFPTFHWHGDTFELPAGIQLLASSRHYPQAFRVGRSAYGVQFHPEVVPDRLDAWIRAYHLELERERLSPDSILAVPDAERHRELARRFARNVVRWLHNHAPSVHENPHTTKT